MAQTFADWLKNQSSTQAPVLPKLKPYSAGPVAPAQSPQTPLSWLIDIVTRPLSGVTNVIDSGIKRAADAGSSGDMSVLNPFNFIGDLATGIFSTDPERHKLTSQVIESATDNIGKAVDRSYVDTQDNVNPVVKGTLGFAGDVLLDPLTYVPIVGWAGKAIGTAGRAAGAGTKVGEALSKAGKTTEKVSEYTDLFPAGGGASKKALATLGGGTAVAAPMSYFGSQLGGQADGDPNNPTGEILGGLGGGLLGFLLGGAAGAKLAGRRAAKGVDEALPIDEVISTPSPAQAGPRNADGSFPMGSSPGPRNTDGSFPMGPAAARSASDWDAEYAVWYRDLQEQVNDSKIAPETAVEMVQARLASRPSPTTAARVPVNTLQRQAAAMEGDRIMLSPEGSARLTELRTRKDNGERLSKGEFEELQRLYAQTSNMKAATQTESVVDTLLASRQGERLAELEPELSALGGLPPKERVSALRALEQQEKVRPGAVAGFMQDARGTLGQAFTDSGARGERALVEGELAAAPEARIQDALEGLGISGPATASVDAERLAQLQARYRSGEGMTRQEMTELRGLEKTQKAAKGQPVGTPEEVFREFGRRLLGTNRLGEDGLKAAQEAVVATIDNYVSMAGAVSRLDTSTIGKTVFPLDGVITVPHLSVTEAEQRALLLAAGFRRIQEGERSEALSGLLSSTRRSDDAVVSDALEAGLTSGRIPGGTGYTASTPPRQVTEWVSEERTAALDRGRPLIEKAIQATPKAWRTGPNESLLRETLESQWLLSHFNEADAYLRAFRKFALSNATTFLSVRNVLGDKVRNALGSKGTSQRQAEELLDGIRRVLRGGTIDPIADKATRSITQEKTSLAARLAYGSDTEDQTAASTRRQRIEGLEDETATDATSTLDSFRQDPERLRDVDEQRLIAREEAEARGEQFDDAAWDDARLEQDAADVEAWAIQERLQRHAALFSDIQTYQQLLGDNPGLVTVLQSLGIDPINKILQNAEKHSRVLTNATPPAEVLEGMLEAPTKAVRVANRVATENGALGMSQADQTALVATYNALKTAIGMSEGATLRNLSKNQWATHAQASLFFGKGASGGLVASLSKEAAVLKLKGRDRAAFMANGIVSRLRMAETMLSDSGVRSVIDDPARMSQPLALSYSDVIGALLRADPELTMVTLFNEGRQLARGSRTVFEHEGTQLAVTNLMDAVYVAARGGSEEAVFAELVKTVSRDKPITNRLVPGNTGVYQTARGYQTLNAEKMASQLAKRISSLGGAFHSIHQMNLEDAVRLSVEEYADIQADTIAPLLRKMFETTGEMDEYGLPVLRQEPVVMDEYGTPALNELGEPIMQAIARVGSEGETLAALAKIEQRVKELATNGGALPESVEAVMRGIDEALPVGARRAAAGVDETVQATLRGDKKGAQQARQRQSDRDAEDYLGTFNNIDETMVSAADLEGRLTGLLDPARRIFQWKQGMARTGDAAYGIGVQTAWWHFVRKLKLRQLIQMPTATIKDAWETLRTGTLVSADPQVQQTMKLISEFASPFLSMGKNSEGLLGVPFFRSNTALDILHGKLPEKYKDIIDIDGAETYAKEEVRLREVARKRAFSPEAASKIKAVATMKHLSEQWKHLDIEDPIDFLHTIDNAAFDVFAHQALGEAFLNRATQFGLTSTTPKAGYVRFSDPKVASRNAAYAALPEDLYFDREMLGELRRMVEFYNMARSPNGDIGKFLRNYYDPLLNAWKTFVTLPNPSFHIRNFTTNIVMQMVAEGTSKLRRSLSEAAQIMQLRGEYQELDVLNAIKNTANLDFQTGVRIERTSTAPSATKVLVQRGTEKATGGRLFDGANRYGLFQKAKDIADLALMGDGTSAMARASVFLTDTDRGPLKLAGKAAEASDHYTNFAHFLQILHKWEKTGTIESGIFKTIRPATLEDAMRIAAEKVLRYHPTSRSMTKFDVQFGRRIIPFYSWFKGIIPAVLESALNHPGRSLVIPKLSYNLAVAMGVHPASLGDPFPEDQEFPSFLRGTGMGPQFKVDGKYYAVNPGFIQQSIAEVFLGGDPVHSIAGMVSPLLRVPAEIVSGVNFGTGAQISDVSDYMDSQIPFGGLIAGTTGYSPTSILSGQLQQTAAMEKGNNTEVDQALRFTNWLSGAGIQNYSKPNHIRYAQLEQSGRAGGPNF